MSFFDTEEAHAVILATVADEGGRPPGSAEDSRLIATAQFGAKKDIHIPISVSCVLKCMLGIIPRS